ncbi:hypothetical protein BDC45DRAFT_535617 [Circinella umbellata]|nr:hypothetical protein BDC45DRAFT_535617 [Circinella umbellata]
MRFSKIYVFGKQTCSAESSIFYYFLLFLKVTTIQESALGLNGSQKNRVFGISSNLMKGYFLFNMVIPMELFVLEHSAIYVYLLSKSVHSDKAIIYESIIHQATKCFRSILWQSSCTETFKIKEKLAMNKSQSICCYMLIVLTNSQLQTMLHYAYMPRLFLGPADNLKIRWKNMHKIIINTSFT